MVVNDIFIQFDNNDWEQVGKYLIVNQIDIFKAHEICI